MKFIKGHIGIYFLLWLFLCSGCASTFDKSKANSFPDRLTTAQNFWRYHSSSFRGDLVPHAKLGPEGELQNILDRLVYVSPLRGFDIKVVVARNNEINAGTNGKLIYLNSALLNAIWEDQDLVAAIMAHELGHIVAHHMAGQNNAQATDSVLRAASPMMSLTQYGGLIVLALREAITLGNRSFGRYDEKEADVIAAYLAHEAGFDPRALNRFFKSSFEKNKVLSGNVTLPITNYTNPQAALQGAGLFLLRASPLYRTHPPSKHRTKAVELVSKALEGELTRKELKQKSKWISDLYNTLEVRTPRSKANRS